MYVELRKIIHEEGDISGVQVCRWLENALSFQFIRKVMRQFNYNRKLL